MNDEQKMQFIELPFKSILEKLGLDLSTLDVNILKEGVTFYLKEKRRPAFFSIDKVKVPKKVGLSGKSNITGGFFFNGMNSIEELNDLVKSLPSELSKIGFHDSGSKRLPCIKCTLELMEQLFDQPSVFEYFQQRYDQPFKVKKKDKITELIETLEFNDADSALIEQLSEQESYDVDSLEGIRRLEEKMRKMPKNVRKIVSNYIERGTISQKAKKISGYKCLVCEQLGLPPLGFLKENNQEHYIESHHVDPVSSGNEGSLSLTNIITLCANHHRQMHYGNVVLVEDNEDSFVFSIDDKIVMIKKIKI